MPAFAASTMSSAVWLLKSRLQKRLSADADVLAGAEEAARAAVAKAVAFAFAAAFCLAFSALMASRSNVVLVATTTLISRFTPTKKVLTWVPEGGLAGILVRYDVAVELVSEADFWCKFMAGGRPVDLGGSQGRFSA